MATKEVSNGKYGNKYSNLRLYDISSQIRVIRQNKMLPN